MHERQAVKKELLTVLDNYLTQIKTHPDLVTLFVHIEPGIYTTLLLMMMF